MANTSDGPKWTAWSVARGGMGVGELGWGTAMVLRTGPKWTAWRVAKWRDIGEGYEGVSCWHSGQALNGRPRVCIGMGGGR